MQESPGKMYGLAVAMTSLAAIAVGLRFYSRYVKKAGFSWDDWTILPAMVRIQHTFSIGSSTPIAGNSFGGKD